MDVICTRCAEPWSIDHVLHENPQGFDREGCLIRSCPSRWEKPPPVFDYRWRQQIELIAAIAPLLGDDLDGFAAFLEDFGF